VEFEWDAAKAASNLSKHGVTYEEATTVFADPLEMTMADAVHSENESRFVSLGLSQQGRIVVVAYTEQVQRVRIISAREATPKERRQYESTSQS